MAGSAVPTQPGPARDRPASRLGWLGRGARGTMLLGLALAAIARAQPAAWLPLAKDGVHDPRNPGLAQLQQPAEALAPLPRDSAGNLVRWVEALDRAMIAPRASLWSGAEVRQRSDEILVSRFGSMPAVTFPHRQHTLWLDCANCHNAIFKDVAGANKLSMVAILNGEQCGVCHGAVAFPLTECNRCHNVPNETLRRRVAQ